MSRDDDERLDQLFRLAVAALDAGDEGGLERLLEAHPELARERLRAPGAWLRDQIGNALDSFFQQPYLLWFVSEDAVRAGTLPPNIAQLARIILRAAGPDHLRDQLDYALQLVSWSVVARTCGVQEQLIDVLLEAGAAVPRDPESALVNGNFAAARHLVDRGAPLTLATALCLERWDDVDALARGAGAAHKRMAFVLAALNGKAEALRRMLALGADVNAVSRDLYSHATPLHHAVWSASLEAVQVLVEAGANRTAKDRNENATPLQWAEYAAGEFSSDDRGPRYAKIAAYLRALP